MSNIEEQDEPLTYQEQLVQDLRDGKLNYKDAAIYTVLFDFVNSNGVTEVVQLLHKVAYDNALMYEWLKATERVKDVEWVDEKDER